MVEVQGLTAPGTLGAVKRKATGVEGNRLAMILAVLERHCRMKLSNKDVFVNVVGGVRITEPAADLAIALAIAGAYYDKRLPENTAVFGELGLAGELRPVPFSENRITEASRLGLTHIITPEKTKSDGKKNIPCQHLHQAIELLK